jgi:hypothetical protein
MIPDFIEVSPQSRGGCREEDFKIQLTATAQVTQRYNFTVVQTM